MLESPYSTAFAPVSALGERERQAMASLYLANYDGSSESIFFHDLARKDEVLLVTNEDQVIGFTTVRYFEREWNGRPIRVVYSGDTIVDRRHWGQQALAFDWIAHMGTLKQQRPDVPLYWFLLVKGHRTFRYLPLFGKTFYPHWKVDRSDLRPLADLLALEMFPRDYNPATGVVEFDESRGHLKSEIALPTAEEQTRADVQYFLERNPGYRRGHELVCICELEMDNMKPLTRRLFARDSS